MRVHAHIRQDKLEIIELDVFKKFLTSRVGDLISIDLEKVHTKRTLPENRYFHGVVIPLIADHWGYDVRNKAELEEVKLLIYEKSKSLLVQKVRLSRDKRRKVTISRRAFKKKVLYRFREENPEKWKAEQMVSNFLRYHKEMKPISSIVSWEKWTIHLHHPDYSKPNEVIPCTPKEHRGFHMGKLEVKPEYIVSLPF